MAHLLNKLTGLSYLCSADLTYLLIYTDTFLWIALSKFRPVIGTVHPFLQHGVRTWELYGFHGAAGWLPLVLANLCTFD
jgi:hypothetical protein